MLNRKVINIMCFYLFAFLVYGAEHESGNCSQNENKIITKIIEGGISFNSNYISELKNNPGKYKIAFMAIVRLCEQEYAPDIINRILSQLTTLGETRYLEGEPKRAAYNLTDSECVSFYIDLLKYCCEKRRKADNANNIYEEIIKNIYDILVDKAPDELIRPWSKEIIDTADPNSTDRNLFLLMGKTGSGIARLWLEKQVNRKVLRNIGRVGTSEEERKNPDSLKMSFLRKSPCDLLVKLALAKLGNTEFEIYFIQMFIKEKKPEYKEEYSYVLGYLGTPGAACTLANEIRSPLNVLDRGGTGLSHNLRTSIILNLSKIYIHNKILWKPDNGYPEKIIRREEIKNSEGKLMKYGRKIWLNKEEYNKYYGAIEKWAEDTFQIEWERERP